MSRHRQLAANIVPFARPAEIGQAEYFRAVLDEHWVQVGDEIAAHYLALANCESKREVHKLQLLIGHKRREQFELDCLREALEHRFFPTRPTRAGSVRCFDIDIIRDGSWWKIHIPQIDGSTKTRRREDAEMIAREHISVIIDIPIAAVTVRVVDGSSSAAR
jgi:hypothetical protein